MAGGWRRHYGLLDVQGTARTAAGGCGLAALLVGGVEQAAGLGALAGGDLGKGELQEWIRGSRFNRDELGQLGSAIDRMQGALADLVSEIAGSVSQLSSAVEEVSAISEQSAKGMASQQSEVSQVATAMNEMQSTVNEVARNTTDAMSAAKDASRTSTQGNQVVRSELFPNISIGDAPTRAP